MSSAARASSHTAAPPPGNPLAADKYLEGKAKAFAWLRDNGYPEDSAVECPVAWGEMDANAHVNNSVYFRWLESGRLANLNALADQLPSPSDAAALRGNGKGKGPILARITFDYGLPVAYPDNVLVAHKCKQVGAKKMVSQAVVYSYAQQCVVGTSDSVVVSYDYDNGRSCPWPTSLVDLVVERGAERLESSAGKGSRAAKL
ncbi:uncharacterized protein RHOBADRAFT_40810 [Rhodotorula graminis WP1]|uniref:Thioesterase domain-containing protein n=1 Tax=Rhodotorula graminis (strain WP1) TaxID=578459 RepID=A0A194SCD1_RHOGW|nr:uncharacterized protein RHOBADRAFT_40810 [Rhodotorula graminis WP1]KPV78262.1 hypothetical protein RHOBADRAFT_40810 [Rhodotorula graminis WP1]